MGENFKIRLDWEKMSKDELSIYLFEIHTFLMDFSTSSINEMIFALDGVARILTDDLHYIMDGEEEKAKILTDNKESKAYERVISLLSSVDKWKAVSTYAKDLRPQVEKTLAENKQDLENSLEEGGFEMLQRMVRESRSK